jgi:glycogen debranching enzyme
MAKGVLGFLSATQAHTLSNEKDSEPGKILHESRYGEMANLHEIPFGQYYGSIDSTPLFIILAGAYYERTNDLEFITSIWPNIREALKWIDQYGDFDQDGFVEYESHSKDGLVQQGWKDSFDSVFHQNGDFATPPIALCEVQGYVFEAKLLAARMANAIGDDALGERLRLQALRLQSQFEEKFWCEDLQMYALALDGTKKPCRVKSSNAGQCLFTGIASPSKAEKIIKSLMGPEMFTGWGIRTIASGESRYNPISYHNGSVWPHDNSLIAYGFSRYGFKAEVNRLFTALYEASIEFDQARIPELFCGFSRRSGEAPTMYPVACSPQAWSASSVYIFIQACLGIVFDIPRNTVFFHKPELPKWLKQLEVSKLEAGDSILDIKATRSESGKTSISVEVLRGNIQVIIKESVAAPLAANEMGMI